jgi:hypothetical protein
VQPGGRSNSFDGGDLFAVGLYSQHQAGSNDAAIEDYGASATVAVVTAFLGAGHTNDVPQALQEALPGFTKEIHGVAINGG